MASGFGLNVKRPKLLDPQRRLITFSSGDSGTTVLPTFDVAADASDVVVTGAASVDDTTSDAPRFVLEREDGNSLLMLCPIFFGTSGNDPNNKSATITISLLRDITDLPGLPRDSNEIVRKWARSLLCQLTFTAGDVLHDANVWYANALIADGTTRDDQEFVRHADTVAPGAGVLLATGIVRHGGGWFGVDVGEHNVEIQVACTTGGSSTTRSAEGCAFLYDTLSVVGG